MANFDVRINISPNIQGRKALIKNIERTTHKIGEEVVHIARGGMGRNAAGAAPYGRSTVGKSDKDYNQNRGGNLQRSHILERRGSEINPATFRGRGPRAIVKNSAPYALFVYEGTQTHTTDPGQPMAWTINEAEIPGSAQAALNQLVMLTNPDGIEETFAGRVIRRKGSDLVFYMSKRRGQEANPWLRAAYNRISTRRAGKLDRRQAFKTSGTGI